MSLDKGARLGPYEIEGPLGSGGMGQVWAARDPRIDRRVAIKGLPEDFSQDPERRARFEREARALAALNHPNVATLFGFEHHDGQPLLIMELVSGDSLETMLESGPLPWHDCLPLFEQIAEGLEAAHSRGLVHRDLKPSNIMVDTEGRPKILDFGLARAMADQGGEQAKVDESPTLTAATAAGMILGTAAYMAPEQARGRPVDHRADVWAWGCCLWETLVGSRPFAGDDVAMTLAAVLSQEPDWSALPADLPAPLRTLLARCLDRDPRNRLQHIGEARWWLGQAREEGLRQAESATLDPSAPDPNATPPVSRGRGLLIGAAVALLFFGATAGFWIASMRDAEVMARREPVRFQVESAGPRDWNNLFGHQVALSADGRFFAYPASGGIHVHSFETGRSKLIGDTENAWAPALSENGESLAFWRDGALYKVTLDGELVQQVALTPRDLFGPLGVVWHDDSLYFGSQLGLFRVSRAGGEPENLLATEDRAALYPTVLPSGRIAFTPARLLGRRATYPIEVFDPEDGSTRQLGIEGIGPRYLQAGYLTWLSRGQLWAGRWLDGESSKVEDATPVLALDAIQTWALPYDVSMDGAMVSGSGAGRRLTWFDESGRSTALDIAPGVLRHPRWSRDGSRIAYTLGGVGVAQIFVYEVASGRTDRLTDYQNDVFPVWAPDGRIVFFEPGSMALDIAPPDRSREPEVLLQTPDSPVIPMTISSDGLLLFGRGPHLWQIRVDRAGESRPWLESEANAWNAAFAPNGRWVAYNSGETGELQVYVRPFEGSGRQVVSTESAWAPSWSSDGRTLYFATQGGISGVDVEQSGGSLVLGEPRAILRTETLSTGTSGFERDYDPHPAGNGLLVVEEVGGGAFTAVLGLDTVVEEAVAESETN